MKAFQTPEPVVTSHDGLLYFQKAMNKRSVVVIGGGFAGSLLCNELAATPTSRCSRSARKIESTIRRSGSTESRSDTSRRFASAVVAQPTSGTTA